MISVEIALIVIFLCCTALFLCGVYRYAIARALCKEYTKEFGLLCDDNRVPLEPLEAMHAFFEQACHPCATFFLIMETIRYRSNRAFRDGIEAERSVALRQVPQDVAARVSRTMVLLYLYASYSVPIVGILARHLIHSLGKRPEDRRKTKFLVVSAQHATGRSQARQSVASH